MPTTITRVETRDIRFPTSNESIGSDATNKDPDYSAAYCILHTDNPAPAGHGLTFTIGRGNELCVATHLNLAAFFQRRQHQVFRTTATNDCRKRNLAIPKRRLIRRDRGLNLDSAKKPVGNDGLDVVADARIEFIRLSVRRVGYQTSALNILD